MVFEDGDAPHPTGPEPERLLTTRTCGRLSYERWFSQGPAGDGAVVCTNTFRVWDAGSLVNEDTSRWRSWPLTASVTTEESTRTGCFDVQSLCTGYLVARRLPST